MTGWELVAQVTTTPASPIPQVVDRISFVVYFLVILTVTLACTVFGANLRAALFLLYIATRDDID